MFKVKRFDEEFQNSVFNMETAKNIIENNKTDTKSVKTVTFQVTEACNLKCTYCYQINKSKNSMTFEYAKRFIDLLLDESFSDDSFMNVNNTSGIIAEFIGGEPLLEIDLIDQITDYFRTQLIERFHPWKDYFMVSMISNGLLYFTDKVQNYLEKNKSIVSFSMSLDGCKELHDACRITHNNEGSYDTVEAACMHFMENFNSNMSTKMTFAPENVDYTFRAIKNLINIGYKVINCNPVYEEGWQPKHANIYYKQLTEVADYIIENKLYDKVSISVFDRELMGKVDIIADPSSDKNYCGSTGHMLALDLEGNIFPCIRFMKSSLGDNIEPFKIGSIFDGINKTPNDRKYVNILDTITLSSQSSEECINCEISKGCGWCTAHNYQCTGTPNKRVTFICDMHKARYLANVYYWNKLFKELDIDTRIEILLEEGKILDIISKDDYDKVKELTKKINL